ncbi:energy transducer TonB [Sphingomonas sp. M1-B02]|uniref:energy transducer TonB n=1 Tax=Sphingomonas sp. M1-B02 TaxID=3114300 RepID=UPI0022403A01|nr:energy transducer TonB [Sphingomonas sp. S6-11]UZK65916.1 energy transducer TonB [Sphingomonas sp. S6-11]
MKCAFLCATALAAPVAAQTAPDVPRVHSGPWVAEFEESMCVLSRTFGRGPDQATFAIRPVPADDDIELVVMTPYSGKNFYRVGQDASVELLPSGQKANGSFRDYTIPGKRLVRFSVPRADISNFAGATSLRLIAGKERPIHLALANSAGAMRTIAQCEDMLLTHWGYDLAALKKVTKYAVADHPETWVTTDDYPVKALLGKRTGYVRMRWTIDVDGRAKNCVIVQSSGHPDLDSLSCSLMLKRARYSPALGADGTPIPAPAGRSILWQIP